MTTPDSKQNRSNILKQGILSLVRYENLRDGDGDMSKQASPAELAMAFEDEEVMKLAVAYECLNKTPREITEILSESVIGQYNALRKLVYVTYTNQMNNLLEEIGYVDNYERMNLLLIGPTGSGKTSSIDALKSYFKVPVAKYSIDSVTAAGWVGNGIEDILYRLYAECGGDLAVAERAIIFIDEIDKKVKQSSSNGKDINGEAVQQELLKLMEPNKIDITLPDKSKITFDTSRLTVIFGGTFVGLDEIRRKRLCKKSLGFRSDIKESSDEELMESGYIAQDIIEYGFIPEFVGRIKLFEELRKLNDEDVLNIIYRGKNSVYIKQTKYLADVLNVEQHISKKFVKNIAEELAKSDTGVRGLNSRIINIFLPIIEIAYEHMGEEGICKIDENGMFSLVYENASYYGEVGKLS